MFMKRLACKFSFKCIVREADIQNRFLEKYTPSPTRENLHIRLELSLITNWAALFNNKILKNVRSVRLQKFFCVFSFYPVFIHSEL